MTRENNGSANEINEIICNALKNGASVQKFFHRASGQTALKIGDGESQIIVLPLSAIVMFKKKNYDMNSETHKIIQDTMKHEINKMARDAFAHNFRTVYNKDGVLYQDGCDIQLLVKTNQIRINNALFQMDDETKDFVEDYIRKSSRKKDDRFALVAIMFICVMAMGLVAWSVNQDKKTQKINEKVSAYEKTLPGYLEQKQKVERYRDSLMKVQKER